VIGYWKAGGSHQAEAARFTLELAKVSRRVCKNEKVKTKLTASILLTQVRKPPDVSQSDGISDDAQEKLKFPAPSGSFFPRAPQTEATAVHYRTSGNIHILL